MDVMDWVVLSLLLVIISFLGYISSHIREDDFVTHKEKTDAHQKHREDEEESHKAKNESPMRLPLSKHDNERRLTAELDNARAELRRAGLENDERILKLQEESREKLHKADLANDERFYKLQDKSLDELRKAKLAYDSRLYQIKFRYDERIRKAIDKLAEMKAASIQGDWESCSGTNVESASQATQEEGSDPGVEGPVDNFEVARDEARKEIGAVIDKSYELYGWLLRLDMDLEKRKHLEMKDFDEIIRIATGAAQHLDYLV